MEYIEIIEAGEYVLLRGNEVLAHNRDLDKIKTLAQTHHVNEVIITLVQPGTFLLCQESRLVDNTKEEEKIWICT